MLWNMEHLGDGHVGQDGTLLWVCQADPTTVSVSSERCRAALSAGCANPLELWGVAQCHAHCETESSLKQSCFEQLSCSVARWSYVRGDAKLQTCVEPCSNNIKSLHTDSRSVRSVCTCLFTYWASPKWWFRLCTVAGRSDCLQAALSWKAGTRCIPWSTEVQR